MITFGIYTIEGDVAGVLAEISKEHRPAQLKQWSLQAIKDLAEEKKAAGAGESKLPAGLIEEWKAKAAERQAWVEAGRPPSPPKGAYPFADDEAAVTGRTYTQVIDTWGTQDDAYQAALRTVAKVRRKHLAAIQTIDPRGAGAKAALRTALVAGVVELGGLFGG